MRSKNTPWSVVHGLKPTDKPKERDIKKDNESMPQELRDLGERMKAVAIIKEASDLGCELMEVWDE